MIEVKSAKKVQTPGKERLAAMDGLRQTVTAIPKRKIGMAMMALFGLVAYIKTLLGGSEVAAQSAPDTPLGADDGAAPICETDNSSADNSGRMSYGNAALFQASARDDENGATLTSPQSSPSSVLSPPIRVCSPSGSMRPAFNPRPLTSSPWHLQRLRNPDSSPAPAPIPAPRRPVEEALVPVRVVEAPVVATEHLRPPVLIPKMRSRTRTVRKTRPHLAILQWKTARTMRTLAGMTTRTTRPAKTTHPARTRRLAMTMHPAMTTRPAMTTLPKATPVMTPRPTAPQTSIAIQLRTATQPRSAMPITAAIRLRAPTRTALKIRCKPPVTSPSACPLTTTCRAPTPTISSMRATGPTPFWAAQAMIC